MKAVTNAQNMNNPATQAVTLEFQKTIKNMGPQKLDEAENIGLLKKILINKDDNFALAWKSQIP
jgi:hypothetical protein